METLLIPPPVCTSYMLNPRLNELSIVNQEGEPMIQQGISPFNLGIPEETPLIITLPCSKDFLVVLLCISYNSSK
jgi:hypothetical protein